MVRPDDEQRVIDEEVAQTAELLRQWEERERVRTEDYRLREEQWRDEQENQRLRAEMDREAAEHERQTRSTSATAELLELRQRVAALEQIVAELCRARQGPAPRRPSHVPSDLAPGVDPPSD